MTTHSQDRADVERVFSKYLRSLESADVALASEVWLRTPEIQVVTPVGRFQGWDGVQQIWAIAQRAYSERNVQATNVSILVAGDAAWLVFDFAFTATLADGKPFVLKGWESHGYQRTAEGWRIAHLHYSSPLPTTVGLA